MAILVIADDLTGAAEIGGIAWRYGLSVEIVHTFETPITKDIRILNTNTRSLKIEEARAHLKALFSVAPLQEWDWIYLKFDSALRGHIKDEILFYHGVFDKENVVFCPVNLALGRVIRDGIYWVEGQPIAETDFAQDPEFPIRESDVLKAIRADSWRLAENMTAGLTEDFPYVVAAVKDEDSLNHWASSTTAFGLYAGAGAFFQALLRQRISAVPTGHSIQPAPRPTALYVCGSHHENSLRRVASVDSDKVVYWRDIGQEREVARHICYIINKAKKVIFAVAPTRPTDAHLIRKSMAEVVAKVQQDCAVEELLIEGGATASSVLGALAIDTLLPVWEYGQGVIRNRVPERELMITLKPGSYPWTEKLWAF